MSALFNFNSFLTVVLLVICTCTFLKMQFPTFLEQKTGLVLGVFCFGTESRIMDYEDRYGCFSVDIGGSTYLSWHHRFRGFFWKAARIGERLSPWVAAGCFTMGVSIIFF
ncbi:hypothetical protein FEM48_Zijuj11G0009200 [Ziziphus jujuba var. spinosa]|uniref:Protein kish n=1 Tax=Ziziphus jujuba var. spinosa TaxID=714518 RepID=A0A978UFX2_ZIZJJ|nr:hypothetical protein FEM48_Zijuj11G0009200 [Ziziphus jujuba var. spinosa]